MTTDPISMESFTPESRTSSLPDINMSYQWHLQKDLGDRLSGLQALPTQHRQPSYLGNPNPASPQQQLTSSHEQNNGYEAAFTSGEVVPLSTVKPGSVYPTEAQLKVARTYGFLRENGTYVPLIPADELSSLERSKIMWKAGLENVIILPSLQRPRLDNGMLLGEEQMVSAAIVNFLPMIDVNRPNVPRAGRSGADETQMQIDSIVAANNNTAHPPPRRQKIYCDKWIHDGTCAFTQLGCKYKHEMPLDKVTQMSLGLNHGIPKWYKLQHQVIFHRRDSLSSNSTTLTNSPVAATSHNQVPWRHGERTIPTRPCDNMTNGRLIRPAYVSSSFGPIAPPSSDPFHKHRAPIRCSNPFEALSSNEYESEEESETW